MTEELSTLSKDNKEIIKKLIEIADVGIKKIKLEDKKFLGIIPYKAKIKEYYTLDEQLAAIGSLSRMSDQEAHIYIKKLCLSEVLDWGSSPGECYGNPRLGQVQEYRRIFPNASSYLRNNLDDPIATPNSDGSNYSERVDDVVFLPRNKAGNLLREAYKCIKEKSS